MLKRLLKYFYVYIGLILLFVILLTMSNLIPKNKLIANVSESAAQLDELQIYHEQLPQISSAYKMDYYTDSVMVNTALFVDNDNPLKSAMLCSSFGGGVDSLIQASQTSARNPNTNYSRYWHGYLIFLRPLLTSLNFIEIGTLNTYIFFFLLVICLLMFYKKIGGWFSIAFILTIISLNIVVLPLNMQLNCVFILSFISMISIMVLYERKKEFIPIGFFIIGMLTMYFDFYTYPILTYGFPMIVVLLLNNKDKNYSNKKLIKHLAFCFLVWALGYGLTWLGKIVLARVIVGRDELELALSSFSSRMSRELPAVTMEKLSAGFKAYFPALSIDQIPLWGVSLGLVSMQIFNRVFIAITFSLICIFIVLYIFFRKKKEERKIGYALLIVAAIPIIWFIVAVNPTIIHYYFQYRGIGVTIFALLSAMLITIDFEKINKAIISIGRKFKKI